MHSLVGLSSGLVRRRCDCSPWHPGARTRRDASGRAADRQILESLVASARNSRAAAERGTDRWIRPTWRVIAGRARRVMAPASPASSASGAGSGAAPALASAGGTIASRAAVCTAICGVTPTAASACWRRMRVEVPGEPTTTGVWANSPPPRACPRRGGSWGEYEPELLLSQWVDGQPLAGEREVRRAKLARAVADQRSYSVSAVGYQDPDFEPAEDGPGAANSVAIGPLRRAPAGDACQPVFEWPQRVRLSQHRHAGLGRKVRSNASVAWSQSAPARSATASIVLRIERSTAGVRLRYRSRRRRARPSGGGRATRQTRGSARTPA